MNFLYKMEKKFGKYAIKNLSLILISCYIAGYIIEFANSGFFTYLTLDPYAILHGQVWRIVSWLLIPPAESNIFFMIIMLIFYYSIGTTLERTWGAFQYNVYLFSGMLFTVLGSFAMLGYCYLFKGGLLSAYSYGVPAFFRSLSGSFSTYYVNMSIFLAFAATFPDNKVLLMFIIPIKVKWLGIAYGAFLVYEIISGVLTTAYVGFVYPFVIGSSLLNFVVFFLTSRKYIRLNKTQRRAQKAYKKQTSFSKKAANSGIAKHRCAICGRTEKDGDDLVFRFCSKCDGNYEFCQDHLYTHIHFTKDNQK